MSKKEKLPPLEEGLLRAMQALDNQVSREMQRSPEELEKHGVQKFTPYEKRVELVTSYVLDLLADQVTSLDSLLILSQSMAKALYLFAEELGKDGLGAVRSRYTEVALQNISRDADMGIRGLRTEHELT